MGEKEKEYGERKIRKEIKERETYESVKWKWKDRKGDGRELIAAKTVNWGMKGEEEEK